MAEMKDSGIEWIGEIPKEWGLKRIQFCLEEINEKNIPIKTEQVLSLVKDKGVMLYENKGNQGNKAKEDISQYKVAYPNTLIVNSMNILIGSVGISDYLGCVSPVYYVFKDTEESDLRYINYIFNTREFQKELKKYANGILEIRLRVSSADIFKRKIPLPDKAMQGKIADFLDKKCAEIDELYTDIEKQIAMLEEYKKSVITEAVTKGLDSSVSMKDSGIKWIGEIPENWDTTKRIKDIFNIGKGLSITKENLIEEGISVISYGQVHSKENTGTYIKPSFIRFVSDEYLKKNTNCLVHKGDFIFADTSEDVSGCGNCVYVDYEDTIFAGYHTIILSNDVSDNRYLAYLFSTDVWRCQIREKVTAVKVYTISQKILKECKIILPSETEQQEIADYLDQKCSEIDKLINIKKQQLITLEEYKKSVIYEYVTGKKEVL